MDAGRNGGRDDGPLGFHASPFGPVAPHPTDAAEGGPKSTYASTNPRRIA
jgi:hypothetical protein